MCGLLVSFMRVYLISILNVRGQFRINVQKITSNLRLELPLEAHTKD